MSVELCGVSKRFGGKTVIEPLNLHVATGEFLVLVGPSGCGKTTVLRLVAGLEEPSTGRIFVGGKDVTNLPPGQRNVAMVFQNYALYPHMTVAENLEFPLKIRRVPKPERQRRVREVAAMLEIGHLLQSLPRQLPGGQRQRVALGRAMVREPAVFLFDEPLSNVDAKLRVQTRAELARLQRRLGTTTLYVTHDQVEAMTLGHRVAVMKDGRILQMGPPVEVYRYPADTFVATFIGSPPMNLFPATAQGEGLTIAGRFFPIPQAALPLRPGELCIAGVRPEHCGTAAPDEPSLALQVEVVELLGPAIQVAGYVGKTWATALLPADAQPRPGDTLPLAFSVENLCVFAWESGQRLHPQGLWGSGS